MKQVPKDQENHWVLSMQARSENVHLCGFILLFPPVPVGRVRILQLDRCEMLLTKVAINCPLYLNPGYPTVLPERQKLQFFQSSKVQTAAFGRALQCTSAPVLSVLNARWTKAYTNNVTRLTWNSSAYNTAIELAADVKLPEAKI